MRLFLRSVLFALAASVSAHAQVTYTWTDITPAGGRVYEIGTHLLDGRIIVHGFFGVQGQNVPVMYSNDHGATWNAPLTSLQESVASMFVHAGLPGVVYLERIGSFFHEGSTLVSSPSPAQKGELYRSADFGRTWSLVHASAVGEWIHPIASDPLDAHGMFGFARREMPYFCPGCRYGADLGISQTNDDGASWSIPQKLPFQPGYPTVFGYTAGPTPADPMRIFVQPPDRFMLESRDRGATWSPVAPSLEPRLNFVVPDPLRAHVLYGFGHYAADHINHNVTLRSDDGGSSWRQIFDSQFSGTPPVVDDARSRTVWLGPEPNGPTSFVMHRSDDAGETWQAVPYPGGPYIVDASDLFSPANFNFQRLVLSPAERGTLYILQNYRLLRGVPSPAPDPIVVEFHYERDRYWLTPLDGEAVSQDYRQQPGDVYRTGLRWGAWNADDAPAGAVGSCRFWPKPEIGRSRVLVQQGFECDALKRDSSWILEAENEFYTLPPRNNACPAETVAVHRFHNLKPDFNHRWVADPGAIAEMRARGWFDEGVRFCGRPLRDNE